MRNVNSGDEETKSAIQNYIGQIEELNNKLAQAEGKFPLMVGIKIIKYVF